MQELMFLHKIVACSCIGKSKKKKQCRIISQEPKPLSTDSFLLPFF